MKLYNGGLQIGSATVDGAGNWTVDVTLNNGTYTITATVTDAAGNEGAADTVNFTVSANNSGGGGSSSSSSSSTSTATAPSTDPVTQ